MCGGLLPFTTVTAHRVLGWRAGVYSEAVYLHAWQTRATGISGDSWTYAEATADWRELCTYFCPYGMRLGRSGAFYGYSFLMESRYPLAEARNKLSDLVAEVEGTHERITITKHGRPAAVLIATADLEEMEATIELLSADDERSEVIKALRRAEADLAAGKISTLDDLAEALKRRGISTNPE